MANKAYLRPSTSYEVLREPTTRPIDFRIGAVAIAHRKGIFEDPNFSISADQRFILENLYRAENPLTNTDIAQELGKPVSYVKRQTHTAYVRLTRELRTRKIALGLLSI